MPVYSSHFAANVIISHVSCLDLNLLDKSGRTPIHNAILGRHVKIIEMLLEAGADASLLDESHDAPLHTAVRTRDENLVKVGVDLGGIKVIGSFFVLSSAVVKVKLSTTVNL